MDLGLDKIDQVVQTKLRDNRLLLLRRDRGDVHSKSMEIEPKIIVGGGSER